MATHEPDDQVEHSPDDDHERQPNAAPSSCSWSRISTARGWRTTVAQAIGMPADRRNVGRLTFYPLAIGLFLVVDMTLRATGH